MRKFEFLLEDRHMFLGIIYRRSHECNKRKPKTAKSNLQMRSVNARKGLNNEVLKSMVSAKTKFMCICFSVQCNGPPAYH